MSGSLILIFKAIILGVVEGITEFLPISSTGHMVIIGKFINFTGEFATLFEIVIQLGAILAIVVLFREKILNSFKSMVPKGEGVFKTEGFKFWAKLIVAFIPSAVLGLLFHDIIEKYLLIPVSVAGSLLVGGLWMIYAENKYRKDDTIQDISQVSFKTAFVIGCFQCLSLLWPGFSRSAATIIGGWIMGLSSVAAAEFSFFLAIPTMLAATTFALLKSEIALTQIQLFALVVGFVISFIVAFLVVAKFLKFLKTKPMRGFAVYRICVAIIILILAFYKLI